MFYSHEILTNRQYGVATIWLVATLGSKSNLKKVTRRAILDVDLLKACETITEPEMPLALRLQGSLLFGASRVFQQQCGYVLTDATILRDNMRRETVIQDMELDPNVGKTRPEQLNLAEDPYFIPELDINFDLSAFGFSSEGSSPSQAESSLVSFSSSQTSLPADEGADEVVVDNPSFSTPARASGGFDFPLGIGTSSIARTGSQVNRPSSVFDEEPAVHEDPLFQVDDDGSIRPNIWEDFLDDPELPSIEDQLNGNEVVDGQGVGTGAALVVEEGQPLLDFDDDIVMFDDDGQLVPPPPPQIPITPEPVGEEQQQDGRPPSSVQRVEDSSETAEAPQRRTRATRTIKPDRQTELTNRHLNEWNQNYLANMAVASRTSRNHLAHTEAKKNAEFWIFHQGLGNVASTFGQETKAHPLSIFSGQPLWEMLRRPERGTKRSRTSSMEDEPEDGERHVRARPSHETVARGEQEAFAQVPDDDGLVLQDDDFDIEMQIGRQAPPSLPDHSSSMPWNTGASGSRQSSAHPPGSGLIPRWSSSVAGLPDGMELGPPSGLLGRRSRLTSASPLFARGQGPRRSSQEPLDHLQLMSNNDEFAGLDSELRRYPEADDADEVLVTSSAAQSQWAATTLENEAYNFLTFVNTKVQDRGGGENIGEGGEGARQQKITFDELLPPRHNSAVVGAQALLHVLSLTTKGLLEVYQAEHFGDIQISVVSH